MNESIDPTAVSAGTAGTAGTEQAAPLDRTVRMPEAGPSRASERVGPFGVGEVLGERYQTIRALGAGGMGVVALARDLRLGRLVVVKAPQTRWLARPGVREAFVREAEGMARIEHPNVVDIRDVGQHRGHPYLVQEFVDGVTLHAWFWQRRGDARELVARLVPLVRGVVAAHQKGVLHLDLKPANAMIRSEDGTVKILDFGLCELSGLLDTSRPVQGTPGYMSPEQWRGEPPTEASDIWALGAMFHRLATGQPVFGATPDRTIQERVLSGEPAPDLSDLAPWLPEPLTRLTRRCLAKDPAARPESAAEVLRVLDAIDSQLWLGEAAGEPYRGLGSFRQSDAAIFFGRDGEASLLLDRLERDAFVAVVGPSGAGKTSFVQAGVVPRLRQGAWRTLSLRPQRRPFAALSALLCRDLPRELRPPDVSATRLREEPGALGVALRALGAAHGARVLLFVDQLEELCTLVVDPRERLDFARALLAAADVPEGPVRVVVGLREDFLTQLGALGMRGALQRGLFLLRALEEDALRAAVSRPAERFGYRVATGVTEEIVTAVASQRSALPLLQFVCRALWERRDKDTLTLTRRAFDALGGLSGALSRHADAVIRGLRPEQRAVARELLCRLVTAERTRASTERRELVGAFGQDAGAVIDTLIRGRLIEARESGGEEPGTVLELVHETLIESWDQLRRWLDDRAGALHLRDRITEAAREWDRQGRPQGLLWTGQAVERVQRWRAEHAVPLSPRDHDFVTAMERARGRARRLRRGLWTAFAALLGVVALVFAASYLGIRSAERTARLAEQEQRRLRISAEAGEVRARSRALAANASESLDVAPMRALLLAREAAALLPTREAHQALSDALEASHERQRFPQRGSPYQAVHSPDGRHVLTRWNTQAFLVEVSTGSGVDLLGHESQVNAIGFSPDGGTVVTGSSDRTVRLWDLAGMERQALRWDRGVGYVVFAPDGRSVLTCGGNAVRLWDLTSGAQVDLRGHEGTVRHAAFDSDGRRILTVSKGPPIINGAPARVHGDGSVRVWDVRGALLRTLTEPTGDLRGGAFGSEDRVFVWSGDGSLRVFDAAGRPTDLVAGRPEPVAAAALGPGGERFLVAGRDGTIWLRELSGRRSNALTGLREVAWRAAFSPDGRRVVAAAEDVAYVWSVHGARLATLRGHRGIRSVAFDPSGNRVLTAGWGGARVWDLGDPRPFEHAGQVHAVAVSPDGQRILTAVVGGTVHLWSPAGEHLATLRPVGAQAVRIRSPLRRPPAGFDPDGSRIVTAGQAGPAVLWDVDGRELARLEGHDGPVSSARFDPAGRRLVTASADHSARVWDLAGTALAVLRGHSGEVVIAEFGPRGERVLTGSADRTARLWTPEGEVLATLPRHGGEVSMAVFSPDGTRFVTASDSHHDVHLWDGAGAAVAVLHGHRGVISAVAFSPDGALIATAAHSNDARLWRRDGEPVAVLGGHEGSLLGVRFSPSGDRLITFGEDRTARLWSTDGEALLVLRGHGGGITDGAIMPDGAAAVTVSRDGTARLHVLAAKTLLARATERATRTLTAEERRRYLGAEPQAHTEPEP